MKELVNRLEWVKMPLTGEIKMDDLGKRIAIEECKCSIAIVEMLGMRSLLERLEEVRDYLCGAKTDKELAIDKIVEAMAIAEVLPEVQIVLPSTPDAKGF